MKKIIPLCITLLVLTGCGKEELYTDYEHYNLADKEVQLYQYLDNEHILNTYAIADITPDPYESHIRGLFYQVGEEDFILLDKIDLYYYIEDDSRSYNAIFNNKLYVMGDTGEDGLVTEYTLNHEKISKKGLNFQIPSSDNHYYIPQKIVKVDINNIYFEGPHYDDLTKCSLEDYNCEYVEN